jgi:hypothetical protein
MKSADLEHRLHLLRANRTAVILMLQKTVTSGLAIEDLVAVVADTRDPVGGPLARALVEKVRGLDADAEAARAGARHEIPTLVAVIQAKLAVEIFKMSNPSVSAGIGQPVVAGRVRVVVVGANGSTLVQVPIENLPAGGIA